MSRQRWNVIKQSKLFYVNTFRRLSTVLIYSVLLNILLGIVLYFVYIHIPTRTFYSTNGETQPLKLTPMLTANNSAEALLAPDDDNSEYLDKQIPN